MENIKHLYFLSWEDLSYSRTGVLYHGLTGRNTNCHAINFPKKNYLKTFRILRKLKGEAGKRSIVVVGSPCSILAIICRAAWPQARIVYDSGWPLIDGLLSRNYSVLVKLFSYVKIYVVDFLAYKFSNLVSVESESQKKNTQRKFFVQKSKVFVSYTGFNEVGANVLNSKATGLSKNPKQIIFRGKYILETGLEYLAESSFYLDPLVKLVIITPNLPKEIKFSPNVEVITSRLTDQQLAEKYRNSQISIGLLRNSLRTNRTIPHKFYESIFFEVPYLTKRNPGIEELLPNDDSIIYVNDISPAEFANFISEQLTNTQDLSSRAEKAKAVYMTKFSQSQIVDNFISHAENKFKLKINSN
jgi:glycosyltransferase involved in cell wall biosynthesis